MVQGRDMWGGLSWARERRETGAALSRFLRKDWLGWRLQLGWEQEAGGRPWGVPVGRAGGGVKGQPPSISSTRLTEKARRDKGEG